MELYQMIQKNDTKRRPTSKVHHQPWINLGFILKCKFMKKAIKSWIDIVNLYHFVVEESNLEPITTPDQTMWTGNVFSARNKGTTALFLHCPLWESYCMCSALT